MYRVGVLFSFPPSLQGESDSTTDLDTSIKGECHCHIAVVLFVTCVAHPHPVLLHVLLPDEKLLRGSELLRISMMVQEANSISNTLGKNIVSYVPTTRCMSRVTIVVSNAVCTSTINTSLYCIKSIQVFL